MFEVFLGIRLHKSRRAVKAAARMRPRATVGAADDLPRNRLRLHCKVLPPGKPECRPVSLRKLPLPPRRRHMPLEPERPMPPCRSAWSDIWSRISGRERCSVVLVISDGGGYLFANQWFAQSTS